MKVGVVGCGYVGLVTGVCFAYLGHDVCCADIAEDKISSLQKGKIPIWEQGLEERLTSALEKQKICFTSDLSEVVRHSDVLFVAVGTPSREDGSADLSQVWSVARQIADHIAHPLTVVIKSTVPAGTCDAVEALFVEAEVQDRIIDVVHNPEFLRQGNAVHDFLHPDRIVIGYRNSEARDIMRKLYGTFSAPVQYCDRSSAELIKYAANAFLAMKISFINMMARLSDSFGANIDEIAQGIGSDRRIGPAFLKPGLGYGGSCFPKDTQALITMGKHTDCDLPLIESTAAINRSQPIYLLQKLEQELGCLQGKRIGLLGLTYKPLTDDIRDAPSLEISRILLEQEAEVAAYDPMVSHYPYPQMHICEDAYQCAEGSDALLLLTEWEEFEYLNISELVHRMKNPLIVDGRNMFSIDTMKRAAEKTPFVYASIGRPTISSRTKVLHA